MSTSGVYQPSGGQAEHTLDETAVAFGLKRWEVLDIQRRAFRKLRMHPLIQDLRNSLISHPALHSSWPEPEEL